jgi:hypothetical protein
MMPIHSDRQTVNQNSRSPRSVVTVAAYAVGAIVLVCFLVILLFPGVYLNGFLGNLITNTFAKEYPAYSLRIARVRCSILKNRVECDGIVLRSLDSAFSCSAGAFSVNGISWLRLLRHKDNAFDRVTADAREIALTYPRSQSEIQCGRLHFSVPDSVISAEAGELHAVVRDDAFFASRKFRRTRFQIVLPQCKATGVDCRELLQGKAYRARSILINDPFFDILVDMDTPYDKNASRPLMPNEALALIKKVTQVNGVNVVNGRLKYAERYRIGLKPAEVSFDSMQLSATGITNHGGPKSMAAINGQGTFMKTSRMKFHLTVPVSVPESSFGYSGSLDAMDLTRLNSFLEIGENLRIKSGFLQTASFDIRVTEGRASGTVRALYKDLVVDLLDKKTGSGNGAMNRIGSFLINAAKMRGTNMPDKSGSLKIGDVKYERRRDDTFLQLLWFSLRSGVGSVIGF